jgi:tetratricopeptide (TPR) repeat protein
MLFLAVFAIPLSACWGSVWKPEEPTILRDYNKRGTSFFLAGDIDAAIRNFNQALKEAQGKDDVVSEGHTYFNIARICIAVGDLDFASKFVTKAFNIFNRMGNTEEVAHAYLYFGTIARRQGKLGDAENLVRKALNELLEIDKPEAVSAAYNNLAYLLIEAGKLKEAEEALDEANDWNDDDRERRHSAVIYANRAELEMARGKPMEAITYLNKSLIRNRTMKNSLEVANDLARLAKILEETNNPDTELILDCYRRAFRVNMTMKLPRRAEQDLESMGRILAPLERSSELRPYVQQLSELRDELERRPSLFPVP